MLVDVDHESLLSTKCCNVLGLINYCNVILSDKNIDFYKKEAENLIEGYKIVFEGYGELPGEVNIEIDNIIKPVIQTARRIPVTLRKQLKEELDKLENKIIEKEENHTEWKELYLLIYIRDIYIEVEHYKYIYITPIPLNQAIKRSNMQFTSIDEILPELARAKVFSTVGTKKGFWQIKLDEESSKLMTFWTPYGRYKWKRLPFGIKSAPEIFQLKMQNLLQGLKGIEILADDIFIYGTGDTDLDAIKEQ